MQHSNNGCRLQTHADFILARAGTRIDETPVAAVGIQRIDELRNHASSTG